MGGPSILKCFAIILMMLGATAHAEPELRDQILQMADDPSPRVRFRVALALGEMTGPEKIAALAKIARRDSDDRWVRSAVMTSVANEEIDLYRALFTGEGVDSEISDGLLALASELTKAVAAGGDAGEIASLLELLSSPNPPAEEVVDATIQTLARDLKTQIAGTGETTFEPLIDVLFQSPNSETRKAAARLSRMILAPDSPLLFNSIAASMKKLLDANEPEESRRDSAYALAYVNETELADALAKILSPANSDALQLEAIRAIRDRDDPRLAVHVLNQWSGLSPEIKQSVLDFLLSRPAWSRELVTAIEAGKVRANQIDLARRDRLVKSRDAETARRAETIFQSIQTAEDPVLFETYRPALTLQGDAARGAAIYRERCAQCHRANDEGYNLGPDWSSVAANTRETLLTNILYPNRTVTAGYTDYVIETADGKSTNGIIAVAGPASITLRRSGGEEEVIFRRYIKSMRDTSLSIMPENLQDGLTAQDMAGLLAFIENLTAR